MGKTHCDVNSSYALGKWYIIEVTMMLKEGAICPSNPFQHASELIIKFKDCQEDHATLQVDGGHDHTCTSPRSIVSFLLIMIELQFQHLIAMTMLEVIRSITQSKEQWVPLLLAHIA